ncbi:hypothetical protein [Stappia sp. ES.058]|uniref:hypothetical protein n=1 Tax=Stappia sp. ES.058 TaxID=1881061 RepID=UPI000879A9B2|nr:hypothetical protein [Stappia sp. ES.058]SDU38335.1 hypothetical protein SAMN05428979_3369 [Stappia sp. ES.058]
MPLSTVRPIAGAALILLAGLVAVLSSGVAKGADMHAGYYYPAPTNQEVYVARVTVAGDATKRSRAAFAAGFEQQQLARGFAPDYHLFVKGEDFEKMIIIATGPDRYDTLFRIRALLAALTSQARSTPLFQQAETPHELTFLDFCKLMGFRQLTVSDGDDLTHQILLR